MRIPSGSRISLLSLLLLLLVLVAGCDHPDRRFIHDAQGRALILHGINVLSGAKGDPLRVGSVTRDDVRLFAERYGFNLVRHLIFWDAVEPQPGVYDETYFDRVEERLDWYAEFGIYVVLDMHQDVYSEQYCCDGAPVWAIRDDGLPFVLQDIWSFNYFQPAVMRAFDNFWDYAQDQSDLPKGHLQNHYADAWAVVVARFKDHPAVLGYDIMNEPHPGSAFELFGEPDGPQAAFDAGPFQAFNERMIARIREVDPDGWIFYEPVYGGPSTGQPSYLAEMEDPRDGESRLAYFPHLYSLILEATERYRPRNDKTIQDWSRERLREVSTLGAPPLLIGEFGVSPNWDGYDRFLRELLDMADHETTGWAYWSADRGGWGPMNPDGSDSPIADHLVRAYARRIAGRPTHHHYDPETRVFELVFLETGVPGPTEIYVPEDRFYPDGFKVQVTDPDGDWSSVWDPAQQLLEITTDPDTASHAIRVSPRRGS